MSIREGLLILTDAFQVVLMALSGLLGVGIILRDVWRSVLMERMGQCVTTPGECWMLMLSADSWDLLQQASYSYCTIPDQRS